TVSIVGFSRGAATARHFINAYLLNPDKTELQDVPIRGAFLFDTVASFGLGLNFQFANCIGINFQQLNFGLKLELPPTVHAVHALSLDEARGFMRPVHINTHEAAKEIYFAGDHSDIGGGHIDSKDNPIGDITLRFMAKEMENCGVS